MACNNILIRWRTTRYRARQVRRLSASRTLSSILYEQEDVGGVGGGSNNEILMLPMVQAESDMHAANLTANVRDWWWWTENSMEACGVVEVGGWPDVITI